MTHAHGNFGVRLGMIRRQKIIQNTRCYAEDNECPEKLEDGGILMVEYNLLTFCGTVGYRTMTIMFIHKRLETDHDSDTDSVAELEYNTWGTHAHGNIGVRLGMIRRD